MTKLSGYLRGNILGLIAIFIALTAGAYAAGKAGKNTVGSKSIKDGQVKGVDLAADSVDSSKVAQNALTGEDINEATLTGVPGDGNSGGTVKSIGTGAGLTGGPIVNSGTVALQSCPNGQLLKSNGTGYACGPDNGGTSYGAEAGGGLALTGTDFRLAPCSNGQILKSNGAGYACAADVDTNTTYTAGSGLALAGTSFSVAPGGVDAGKLADNAVTTPKLAGGSVTSAKLGADSVTDAALATPLIFYAMVDGRATGSVDPPLLIRNRGVSSVTRLNGNAQGRYLVNFTQNVSNCVATVSITDEIPTEPGEPGFALAVPSGGGTVFVRTSGDGAADLNQPFALIVACP